LNISKRRKRRRRIFNRETREKQDIPATGGRGFPRLRSRRREEALIKISVSCFFNFCFCLSELDSRVGPVLPRRPELSAPAGNAPGANRLPRRSKK
jgi:hypothetical protein